MLCYYILECAFRYPAEVVVGRGPPSVKRRGAMQNEWLNCCPRLGNASREDVQGERSSAAVSISSLGVAKKGAG